MNNLYTFFGGKDSRDLVEINGIYEVHKDWSTILPYYFAFIICPVSKKLGKVPKSVLILAPGSINETVHRMEVRDLSEPKEFRKRRDKKLGNYVVGSLSKKSFKLSLTQYLESFNARFYVQVYFMDYYRNFDIHLHQYIKF